MFDSVKSQTRTSACSQMFVSVKSETRGDLHYPSE